MSVQKWGGYTPLFCFFCLFCAGRRRNRKNRGFYATLRGFRHSAACMVARKSNAAMGRHGGGAGDGIGAGDVRFQLHHTTKNLLQLKRVEKC